MKLIHRNQHHLVSIDDISSESYKYNISLLRDGYNEGRQGNWNNYCCLKGTQKGSFVKNAKDSVAPNSKK